MALTKMRPDTLIPTREGTPLQRVLPADREASAAAAKYPSHVEAFLAELRGDRAWPAKSWDKERDTIAYARQVLLLNREQCREVYYLLRQRHTFRPSVAEVHAAVEEVLDATRPIGEDAAARRFEMSPQTAAMVLADPNATQENREKALKVLPNLQIASTGEGVGRSRARAILNELRQRSGLPTKESAAATAKYAPKVEAQ